MEQNATNAFILNALQQLKREMFTYFDPKLDNLQTAADALQSSLKSLGDQVGELEFRVSSNQDNITDLEQRVETLEKQNAFLLQKAEDAENRSRALNLRFIHVPERAEGTDTIGFIGRLPTLLFGEAGFPIPPVIERAHRTPGASSKGNSKAGSRPILAKFGTSEYHEAQNAWTSFGKM